MRTFALFGAKNLGFFEIYGVSTRTRGEVGQLFAIFCGRVLWTAPKNMSKAFKQCSATT